MPLMRQDTLEPLKCLTHLKPQKLLYPQDKPVATPGSLKDLESLEPLAPLEHLDLLAPLESLESQEHLRLHRLHLLQGQKVPRYP